MRKIIEVVCIKDYFEYNVDCIYKFEVKSLDNLLQCKETGELMTSEKLNKYFKMENK